MQTTKDKLRAHEKRRKAENGIKQYTPTRSLRPGEFEKRQAYFKRPAYGKWVKPT